MRHLLLAGYLAVGLIADETAFAQSGKRSSLPPPGDRSSAEIREIDERVADWLKQCLDDWDSATHMTQVEWRTTCKRVAAERGKFLREQPDALDIGKKRQLR